MTGSSPGEAKRGTDKCEDDIQLFDMKWPKIFAMMLSFH